MIISPEKWKSALSRQFGLPPQIIPTPIGTLVKSKTKEASYFLLDFSDLSDGRIHDAISNLPMGTRAIVAFPPEPKEEQYRMKIRVSDLGQKPIPVNRKLWLIVPTIPSPAFQLPFPWYLDTGLKMYRIDGKEDDDRGSTWLCGIEGRMWNLGSYEAAPMGVETEVTPGKICLSCKMGLKFDGCDHIVSPLAGGK
jgi:hypothetical protein